MQLVDRFVGRLFHTGLMTGPVFACLLYLSILLLTLYVMGHGIWLALR